MVLKSDENTDASEDSSCTVLASEWRRGQKGPRKSKDGSSVNRRSNNLKEVFCSGTDKDNTNKSLESGLLNSLDQGVEVVNSRTSPGSSGLGYDMEDSQHESMKHSQISEATTQNLSVSSRNKCHDQTDKVMGSNEFSESDEKGEPSLQASLGDKVDESDVEEDVKVCDTCGDAGREDLLAVCSRCIDGAEHTYCMKEMLDKVPDGDWLCEECKYNEALEARRKEHLKLLGTERSKSLGRTNSVNSDVSSKLDRKNSFSERSKPKTVSLSKQLSFKRSVDNIEAGPTAKKPVVESRAGSPTALSPSRVSVLSKDCSSKNSDMTKGKPTNQYSAGTESGGDSSENTRSPTRNLKGDLLKSNSFSSSKANFKVSEDDVQKRKLVVDVKDVPGKLIGKSMSFKGLGRSSVGEPKVKMLSPKCAPVQDLKGLKQIRDRNSFERKNSIKLDNSVPFQTTANSTKRIPRGDGISTVYLNNNRDYKNAPSDGKLNSPSKQANSTALKSPDAMTSLGDVKRLSSTNIRGSGTSSFAEAKPSLVSSKEGSTFNSSRVADGLYGSANGTKGDMRSERVLENAFGRSKQGANGALVGGVRRGFSSDASTLRVKDGVHEENKLKAAIEAAMQKKQDIFKKNKLPDKLSELLMSNSQGNHLEDTVSDQVTDLISEETVHARDVGVSNHTSNSCKDISIGCVKQFKAADIVSSSEEDQFTVSAIPEQEAVWQGGFEIHRNGKLPDFFGGFQAHLSSSASDKVLQVARKIPPKIVFNEVSRHCVWPFQIKEAAAREDNIALYFFAKDLESYMRSYKILLEYMMKHDIALKGNINGFELLIFTSNNLAHRSQRWNTLYFLWGVFRGRRARYPDDRCPRRERPENARPAVEESSLSGIDTVVSRCESPVLVGSSLQKFGGLANGERHDGDRNVGGTCLTLPTSQINLEQTCEEYSTARAGHSESGTTVVEVQNQLDPKVVQHLHSPHDGENENNIYESKTSLNNILDKRDILSHSSKLHVEVKQKDCSVFASEDTERNNADEKSDNNLKQEFQCVDNIKKIGGKVIHDNNVDQMEENKDSSGKNDKVEPKLENRLKQGYVDINVSADCSMDDSHSLQSSPRRHSDEDSVKLASEATSMTSQKRPWMDQKDILGDDDQTSISKRLKRTDGFYGHKIPSVSSSFGDRFDTQMHDVSTSSRINDRSNEAHNAELKSLNPGSAERCFFLTDSHAAQTVQSEDCSLPWNVSLLGTENRLPDGSPDLELALGVEKKQSRRGSLPFFAGIIDRKGPDRPPDIASPKREDEDASASLSLSLAFPFSDKDSPVRSERPLTAVERHEANTSLLFFRGSSGT